MCPPCVSFKAHLWTLFCVTSCDVWGWLTCLNLNHRNESLTRYPLRSQHAFFDLFCHACLSHTSSRNVIVYSICILPVYVIWCHLVYDYAHVCSALALLLLQVCSVCCRCEPSWIDRWQTVFFRVLQFETFHDTLYLCWLGNCKIDRLAAQVVTCRDMSWHVVTVVTVVTHSLWCSYLPSLYLFLDLSASTSQDDNGSRRGHSKKSVNTKGEQYI